MQIHPYTLPLRGPANALSGSSVSGVLVRADGGYACLQSWPGLGEPGLDELLGMLRNDDREEPLLRRLFDCLEIDAAARSAGRSLFEGVEMTSSYYSVPPDPTVEELREAAALGFRAGKIKGGRNAEDVGRALSRLADYLPEWTWRVDFNGSVGAMTLASWWSTLDQQLRGRIDYLEDPGLSDEAWAPLREEGARCAIDRCQPADEDERDLLVVKPAVRDWRRLPAGRELVFTSNLQHPLGLAFDWWEASQAAAAGHRLASGGLVTQHLINAPFGKDWLGEPLPVPEAPSGAGLGWGRELERLEWSKL